MMVMFLLLPPLPCWVRSHGRPPNSIKFTFLCALGEIAWAFLNFCPDSPPIVWCCAVCAFFSSFFSNISTENLPIWFAIITIIGLSII
ncbi:hypothetical protein M6B38_305075 [Iris pallida]|uniref:Secreted protein n=1 Tax=Iris pallida TaxID=29817 RepID=A0AAX6HLB4_IRIPA|nr:hypothetical protein M6B38_305075 [Iris pallida]